MTQPRQVTVHDLEMPKAVILRRIKHAVDGKPFQKEAKLALARAVTVFISYLTTHALEESSDYQRPASITSVMLKSALARIGFGDMEEEIYTRMQQHLAYTKMRAQQKAANAATVNEHDSEGVDDDEMEMEEGDSPDPPPKHSAAVNLAGTNGATGDYDRDTEITESDVNDNDSHQNDSSDDETQLPL